MFKCIVMLALIWLHSRDGSSWIINMSQKKSLCMAIRAVTDISETQTYHLIDLEETGIKGNQVSSVANPWCPPAFWCAKSTKAL